MNYSSSVFACFTILSVMVLQRASPISSANVFIFNHLQVYPVGTPVQPTRTLHWVCVHSWGRVSPTPPIQHIAEMDPSEFPHRWKMRTTDWRRLALHSHSHGMMKSDTWESRWQLSVPSVLLAAAFRAMWFSMEMGGCSLLAIRCTLGKWRDPIWMECTWLWCGTTNSVPPSYFLAVPKIKTFCRFPGRSWKSSL